MNAMKTRLHQSIENLKSRVKGKVILPGDPGYDDARRIWNAMIDRRPAVIVQCTEAADVPNAVLFARDHELEISIRGAGHNIAGNAVCDNGMMIDFSGMRTVRVDVESRRAQVEPGATLNDVDRATQRHGLATPLGINSTTGIAGLTLGGGFGWLTRKYGMTIDNLASVDLVTADGSQMRCSDRENTDLYWAVRGGGGNFGVVTRFEFSLHPVGPEILAGLLVFPFAQARQVFAKYREFVKSAPEDMNVWVVLRKAPPLPFLPADVHGKEIVALAVFYAGNDPGGQKLIEPLRRFGDAHGEHIGAQPYTQWQQAFDPLLTPGARNYWKSHNFTDISDGTIDAILQFAGRLPTAQCEIFLGLIAGAANRIPADATAYGHRGTKFVLNVHGRWDHPADDARCIAWARDFFKASAPYASAGAYVNFMTAEETDRIAAAYGSSYARLVQIKSKYDPDNIFHMNQNIKP
jgi:FAD/FMN-containing dehydrogenase